MNRTSDFKQFKYVMLQFGEYAGPYLVLLYFPAYNEDIFIFILRYIATGHGVLCKVVMRVLIEEVEFDLIEVIGVNGVLREVIDAAVVEIIRVKQKMPEMEAGEKDSSLDVGYLKQMNDEFEYE